VKEHEKTVLGRLSKGDEKLKPNLTIKNKINDFQHQMVLTGFKLIEIKKWEM